MNKVILLGVLVLVAAIVYAGEWILITVKAYEEFPGGLLILQTEPVASLKQETPCIAQAQIVHRKRVFAVYDSVARYYPDVTELHVDSLKLLKQFEDSTASKGGLAAMREAIQQWAIQPK